MKVFQVKSNDKLPVIIRQGMNAVVHCNEKSTSVETNGEVIEGFEYEGVVIEDGISYNEDALVEVATKFLAKEYLNQTDWIVTKINEYQVIGKDIDELLSKYAEQLTKREEARTKA